MLLLYHFSRLQKETLPDQKLPYLNPKNGLITNLWQLDFAAFPKQSNVCSPPEVFVKVLQAPNRKSIGKVPRRDNLQFSTKLICLETGDSNPPKITIFPRMVEEQE
mgnify:CR=1 FL=1